MRRVLKYPGSKWNIVLKLKKLIPKHHSYIEPYFGSGALFFTKEPSNIETINDLDSDVTNLFSCIQEDSGRLAGMLLTTPYSREVYDRQYEPDAPHKKSRDNFIRAADFLVRCWQGYTPRTNDRAGWKNDIAGREKMYALWEWYNLPEWVVEIAERLRRVQIENRPALELIRQFNRAGVFMYIDPPYLFSVRDRKQYKHEMAEADHETLLCTLIKSNADIMISGYESDLYNDYLAGWNKEYFKSCSNGGRQRKEVVWMNYNLDGQMDFSDFPELLPKGGDKRIDNDE